MEVDTHSSKCRKPPAAYQRDPWASVAGGSSYQIEVFASEVDELVKSVGGWLFDRVSAGWVVNVLLPHEVDIRPLEILGLRAIFCDAVGVQRMPSRAMLAAADRVRTDVHVRKSVAEALRSGLSEVTLWGSTAPKQLSYQARPARYRMSAAARAFKAQALVAASVPHPGGSPPEAFLDYAGWCCSDGSDSRRLGKAPATEPTQRRRSGANVVVRPGFGG